MLGRPDLPFLFKKDSDELLDNISTANLQALADTLKVQAQAEPTARFQIEGHASKDGDDQHNQALSEKRAEAIRRRLVADYQVDAKILKSQGFGETYAVASENAAEVELQKDRVVRVVKTQ